MSINHTSSCCSSFSEKAQWLLPQSKSELGILAGTVGLLYLLMGPPSFLLSPLLQLGQALSRKNIQPIKEIHDLSEEPGIHDLSALTTPPIHDLSEESQSDEKKIYDLSTPHNLRVIHDLRKKTLR